MSVSARDNRENNLVMVGGDPPPLFYFKSEDFVLLKADDFLQTRSSYL